MFWAISYRSGKQTFHGLRPVLLDDVGQLSEPGGRFDRPGDADGGGVVGQVVVERGDEKPVALVEPVVLKILSVQEFELLVKLLENEPAVNLIFF